MRDLCADEMMRYILHGGAANIMPGIKAVQTSRVEKRDTRQRRKYYEIAGARPRSK